MTIMETLRSLQLKAIRSLQPNTDLRELSKALSDGWESVPVTNEELKIHEIADDAVDQIIEKNTGIPDESDRERLRIIVRDACLAWGRHLLELGGRIY
jgi:hypothetical protein